QKKLRVCDISDDDLRNQAWSLDAPKADRPRLRMPGDRGTPTWKSQQQGAGGMGRGCWLGIRNVVAHSVDAPDRQVALEHLACLSTLARWIDGAEVERCADPS